MADKHLAELNLASHPRLFGLYQVEKEIGRGGMGVVYQGVHINTGKAVAIKTVRIVPDHDHHLAAIRREIQALRRVDHPGIVRILDHSVTDEVPWLAMDLLQGRTLKEHLAALRSRPPSAGSRADEETRTADPAGDPPHGIVTDSPSASARWLVPRLTLIHRLCAPLAFLHSKGLVHRDLKPANVFLQDGDRPVLVDLGIAGHFSGVGGREEVDIEPFAGTVAYMAPEQISGELVDARADLYALGCILYECVTGWPPFPCGDTAVVLQQHRDALPVPPSRRVRDLPPGLDELILKLLQKDPSDRIGYAAAVAVKLVELGAQADPNDRTPPCPYLYRSGLVGRAADRAMLDQMVDRAVRQRRGGLALVSGESGVGKTRLVREQAYKAAQPRLPTRERLTVYTGCCMAPGAGEVGATAAVASPLHPLRSVLVAAADRARKPKTEADRLFGHRDKVLSAYVRELLHLPGKASLPPSSLPPDKARTRIIRALRETLWALAETSPLLIVLDDLQWADDLTLSLLDELAKADLDKHGVLIVATYRSEETRRELEELSRRPGVTPIPLRRLDPLSVEKMALGMLAGSELPPSVRDALVLHSNGNPFFVAEYLRAALDEGLLQQEEGGRFCFDTRGAAALLALPLPHTLAELIGRRLNQLDAEGQALAEWAAVLGQEIDGDLLLLGARSDAAAMESLEALRMRQILEETEGGRLRFVHDKIREIAYQRIDQVTRAKLHRRAGKELRARRAEAAILGHHFEKAGLDKKAGQYFIQAAKRAQAVFANGDAIGFYQAAIAALTRAGAERAQIAELREQLGDLLALIGRQKAARNAYRAALEATSPAAHLALARLHRKTGKTWEMRHQHVKALKLYRKAEAALGPARALVSPRDERALAIGPDEWWHEWLQIQLDRISVYYWKADIKALRALVKAIRPAVKQRGTALQQGHYLHALTQLHIQEKRFVASAKTVRYARECVAAYEAAGEASDGHWGLVARCSLAIILLLRGSLEEARWHLDDALSDARRTGDLEAQTRCLTYLTVVHRKLRQIGLADTLAHESLRLAREENVREYVGAALSNLAWIALRSNNDAEAERAGREALACWKQLSLVYPFQWLARLPLCFVALAEGRLQDAIEQARAVLEVGQQRLPKRLTSKLQAAITAFEEDREDHAKRVLGEALERALERNYA